MPEMMEIYKKFAANYDELVTAEDYQENLERFLQKQIDWERKIVYEAGIGTGRVTKIYIDNITRCYGFDREPHMLKTCQDNLCDYQEKLELDRCENSDLKKVSEKADVFIEGWSFGHTILENEENYRDVFKSIYTRVCDIVKMDGKIVLIETLGTNVPEAKPPNVLLEEFYRHIENEYQFTRSVLTTDYRFPDYKEAARIMGFFFEEDMFDHIMTTQKETIPEFTGVWVKENTCEQTRTEMTR
ncbi:MAG: methyltransferase domain-containing protein [bacterium]|nr:methyltransferase domain-containing protein [bacterium]